MKNRLSIPLLCLACLGVEFASTSQATAEASDRPPNIVFILTDDQGYGDVSAHGNPVLKTPNLDRLHHEGVRFTDFHVSPTCSPTRSALFTGRHEFKNGVTHTILERERLTLKATTLPQVLQSAGYKTGIFGKWHLGDEPDYQPQRRGFDEVFIHGCGGIGQQLSDGVADYVAAPYSDGTITYVEYAYALQRGFPVASILNRAGYYAQPTSQNVAIALQGARINPDRTQVLDGVYTFNDPRAYPVSSYSYMIAPSSEAKPFSAAKGDTLGRFILYFLCFPYFHYFLYVFYLFPFCYYHRYQVFHHLYLLDLNHCTN